MSIDKKALMKGPLRAGNGLGGLWDSDLNVEFKEKIRRFSRLAVSVFRLRTAKTGENCSDRLISLKGGIQPMSKWCGGGSVMAAADATGGTLIGKNCLQGYL